MPKKERPLLRRVVIGDYGILASFTADDAAREETTQSETMGAVPEGSKPELGTGDKRRQEPKTNEDKKRRQTKTNEDKTEDNKRGTGDKNRRQTETTSAEPETNGDKNVNLPSKNRRQTETTSAEPETDSSLSPFVSGSSVDCLRLKESLSPVSSPEKPVECPPVSVCNDSCLRLQPETKTGDKRRQTSALTAPQQRTILSFLLEKQQETGLNHTPRLKRSAISYALNIPFNSVAKQIDRLITIDLLRRLGHLNGRGDSGSIYHVPPAGQAALATGDKRRQETETNGDKKRRQEPETSPRSSSSSYSKQTTTTARATAERLQQACDSYGLAFYEIGPNDLCPLLRNGAFESEDDLVQSIEHIAWYLRSSSAQGIKTPKAWAMAQLRQGYYGPPADFQSREEQQAALKLEATKRKLQRLREVERQQYELDFEVWLAEMTPDQLRSHLADTPVSDVRSLAAKNILRDIFSKQSGRLVPETLNEA